MAIGTGAGFQLYNKEFIGGVVEVLAQSVDKFNEGSAGTIRLRSEMLEGSYAKEVFFDLIASLITRRDVTSTSVVTDLAMTSDEFVSVKVDRKVGPVGVTKDAFRKMGKDSRLMSFILGKQIATAKINDMLNTAIKSAVAAIRNVGATTTFDATSLDPSTATHGHLVNGLNLFGDRANDIKAFVCHSGVQSDLLISGMESGALMDTVAGVVINKGTINTLGRPLIVTDSANLFSGGPFYILGLVEGGIEVTLSEEEDLVVDIVTGLENIVRRVQGEYAFNIGLKGYEWDTGNGGASPTDATLATGSNWDMPEFAST